MSCWRWCVCWEDTEEREEGEHLRHLVSPAMAHDQELLDEASIIKFKDQDFEYLRDRCLSRGQLFEDDTFPAVASSVGHQLLQEKGLRSLQWKRPWEMDSSRDPPHFILEGASRFDIQQGVAGDCWFLAALGALTQNPKCLKKILPMDQSFSQQYAGIFHFRFWQCGQWVDVVVDDRLPVLNQQYLFVHPRRDNREFWPCLLEKAYAKLHGSYFHLHGGHLPDSLVDLTGRVVTSADLYSSPSDLVLVVKTAAQAGSLMACATPAGPTGRDDVMRNGLVSRHAYTVTGAEKIQYGRGWEEIIRLWNPWGKTEWRGRWSDGSQEWQETHDPRKGQLYENKEDGEFWISCQDFQDNFSCLYICNQSPITLDRGNTLHERWSEIMFKNQELLGNPPEGLPRDPQYFFSVQEPTEGNNVLVSFTVMPQNLMPMDKEIPLSFQVFKVDSQFQHFRDRLPPTFFSHFRNAAQGILLKTKCNFTQGFHLSPGTYVVVPSTGRREMQFLLRIFLKLPDTDRTMDSSFNVTGLKASLPESGFEQSIFQQYAQQGLDIDATQLQNLLNQQLLKGASENTFSLDECRSLVALMDLEANGRLGQKEFQRLWARLVDCQYAFQNSQESGVLLTSDLWKAIKNTAFLAGISVSRELLELLRLRYRDPDGRMSFPSLVCLLMRLEAMTKVFRNLSQDGKGLYLTETEWMNLVMYS